MNISQLIEPATSRLVKQRLTQMRHRVSHEGEVPMRNENVYFHLVQCTTRQVLCWTFVNEQEFTVAMEGSAK